MIVVVCVIRFIKKTRNGFVVILVVCGTTKSR